MDNIISNNRRWNGYIIKRLLTSKIVNLSATTCRRQLLWCHNHWLKVFLDVLSWNFSHVCGFGASQVNTTALWPRGRLDHIQLEESKEYSRDTWGHPHPQEEPHPQTGQGVGPRLGQCCLLTKGPKNTRTTDHNVIVADDSMTERSTILGVSNLFCDVQVSSCVVIYHHVWSPVPFIVCLICCYIN